MSLPCQAPRYIDPGTRPRPAKPVTRGAGLGQSRPAGVRPPACVHSSVAFPLRRCPSTCFCQGQGVCPLPAPTALFIPCKLRDSLIAAKLKVWALMGLHNTIKIRAYSIKPCSGKNLQARLSLTLWVRVAGSIPLLCPSTFLALGGSTVPPCGLWAVIKILPLPR